MLQTCTRCRTRRIKCDSSLPACANCAKGDLECTFRDDALQQDIPRSYIQTLNERIETLTSQLALHRTESSPRSDQPSDSGSIAPTRFSQPLYSLTTVRPGTDLHLDNSIPQRFTRVVFEALSLTDNPVDVESNFANDDHSMVPSISYSDRSQLTPSIVRYLLGRYDRCIRPVYDIMVPGLLDYDGASFNKLPDSSRFKILMACAIAAARESYKAPSWKPLAQICRDWVNELITPIISVGDGDTLAAILLLLVYELADPTRGIIWELLDLAARTCLQRGWHQNPVITNSLDITGDDGSIDGGVSTCMPDEVRLMSVLKDIEGSLQTIFNRPTMLRGTKLPTSSENEPMFDLYTQISTQIYGSGRVYETQGCPFLGEVASLMDLLESVPTQRSVANEAWLLFLPVCSRHKQCLFCFQEADEETARGMRTLKNKVIAAAAELITNVYATATSQDGFIPPIIASSRALIAGCSIATSILKKWTPPQAHAKNLIKCTEILTMFAPHWKGGNNYLGVWRTIIDLIDLEQPRVT